MKSILLLLIMACLLSSCDRSAGVNEMTNKSEYSVLQHYELEYRSTPHTQAYRIEKNAIGSELTVIAFPMSDRNEGYVGILARSEADPRVKVTSNDNFVVSRDDFAAVRSQVAMSPEVEKFIAMHVR